MNMKGLRHSGTRRKGLYLVMFFLSIIASLLLGCDKENATEPKGVGPVGTCEILDKLPKDVKPIEINYGDRINLMGVAVDKQAQDKLRVTYYWKPIDELEAYNVVFVHFTDKDNKGVFQNDHPFCQKQNLKELKAKILKETYVVKPPESAKGKEIYLKIGLYDPKSQKRLKIESAGGVPTDDGNTRAIVEEINL